MWWAFCCLLHRIIDRKTKDNLMKKIKLFIKQFKKTLGIILFFTLIVFVGYKIIHPIYQQYKLEKINTAKQLSDQQTALNKATQEITALQNKKVIVTTDPFANIFDPSAVKIKEPAPVINPENNVASIVSEWSPRIVNITCVWWNENISAQGSGTLMVTSKLGLIAQTNKHLVTDNNGAVPDACVVGAYREGARTIKYNASNSPYYLDNKEVDEAVIVLSNYSSATDQGGFDKFAMTQKQKFCQDSDVSIGDSIIVLGYPAIGSQSSITATEGIVSGIEDQYYVTSAKIDHGNSGGAAILEKDNCWLGIPTASEAGSLESLGRILKASVIGY